MVKQLIALSLFLVNSLQAMDQASVKVVGINLVSDHSDKLYTCYRYGCKVACRFKSIEDLALHVRVCHKPGRIVYYSRLFPEGNSQC